MIQIFIKNIRRKKLYGIALLLFGLIPLSAYAHCPLCTAGAGILAVVAASLGVPAVIIATLLGGFAMALGLWASKVIKKKYIRFQDHVVTWLVYLSTVLPLWPVLKEYKALHLPFFSIDRYTNTTPVNIYLVGIIIGAVVLLASPYLSRYITKLAGKQLFPYQGITITMVLLILIPLIIDMFFLII